MSWCIVVRDQSFRFSLQFSFWADQQRCVMCTCDSSTLFQIVDEGQFLTIPKNSRENFPADETVSNYFGAVFQWQPTVWCFFWSLTCLVYLHSYRSFWEHDFFFDQLRLGVPILQTGSLVQLLLQIFLYPFTEDAPEEDLQSSKTHYEIMNSINGFCSSGLNGAFRR